MRSMAVRPSSFSRLRCWAGRELVVEHDRVAVGGQGQLAQLLGLALADVGGRVGRVRAAARGAPTSSAPAVSTSSESSSRPASVSSAVAGGRVTPTRTIFSRKARSISDTATVPDGSTVDDGDGRRRRGARPDRRRGRPPPARPACATVDGVADAGPSRGRRPPTAQAPVPQARVGPTPRSYTHHVERRRRWRRAARSRRWRRPGWRLTIARPERDRARRRLGERRRRPAQHEVRVADVDPRGREHVAVDPLGRRRRRPWPGPCRRDRAWVAGAGSARTRDGAQPGVGGDGDVGPAAQPGLEHRLGEAADAVAAHLGPASRRR